MPAATLTRNKTDSSFKKVPAAMLSRNKNYFSQMKKAPAAMLSRNKKLSKSDCYPRRVIFCKLVFCFRTSRRILNSPMRNLPSSGGVLKEAGNSNSAIKLTKIFDHPDGKQLKSLKTLKIGFRKNIFDFWGQPWGQFFILNSARPLPEVKISIFN